MVTSPITSSLQKFAPQNILHGMKENVPLNRAHFSGPSSGGFHQHHHVYHDYDGGGHGHSHHGGGGKKRSIALSALTLLAFLFFLNILQNCLQEQMDEANPQIVVMASRLHQHFREEQNRQETSKSASSESSSSDSLEDRKDTVERNVPKKNNFQRIDHYFNSSLSGGNKKHNKKGKF